jgi:acyl-CoA thioesterase FadM
MDNHLYETTSLLRFRDTDPMQMANHAAIVSYLERARPECITGRFGCDYRSPMPLPEPVRQAVDFETGARR